MCSRGYTPLPDNAKLLSGARVDQQALKEQVAEAALERVAARHNDRLLLGIGTGTTAECFIRTLPAIR